MGTDLVMHGHSHGERTRGHANSDAFDNDMVKAPATSQTTDTGRDWNDNGNVDKVTDTVTNTNSVHEHGLGHGHWTLTWPRATDTDRTQVTDMSKNTATNLDTDTLAWTL